MTQAERDRLAALKEGKKEPDHAAWQLQGLLDGLRKEGDKAVVHRLQGSLPIGRSSDKP